jgi:hypothetical protein
MMDRHQRTCPLRCSTCRFWSACCWRTYNFLLCCEECLLSALLTYYSLPVQVRSNDGQASAHLPIALLNLQNLERLSLEKIIEYEDPKFVLVQLPNLRCFELKESRCAHPSSGEREKREREREVSGVTPGKWLTTSIPAFLDSLKGLSWQSHAPANLFK